MTSKTINPDDIQGDIHPGFSKKAEEFYFFKIIDTATFRSQLSHLIPYISTGQDVADGCDSIRRHKDKHHSLLPIAFINVAFSAAGLKKIGIADDTQDPDFQRGMFPDAANLGDTIADWESRFTKACIDGVFVIGGDSATTIASKLRRALEILAGTVEKVISLKGHVRPKDQDGHEHFGFKDGISNPSIDGLDKEDLSTQGKIAPGVIFHGRDGDTVTNRPAWTKDGTFLAFRYLAQLVPEFDQGIAAVAPRINDPTANAVELAGARVVGRWKSGAPVQLTPLRDDPVLAADPKLNNAFAYDDESQEKCPFAAHTRKMNPRGDSIVTQPAINVHRVLRRGIQFGPEVTEQERASGRTQEERGLLFACYQSALDGQPGSKGGFAFLQKSWANNTDFPPSKPQTPGLDPLIGAVAAGADINVRPMSGLDLDNPTVEFSFSRWVVAKGGEYFFVPSLPTLRDVFARAEPAQNDKH